MGFPSPKKNHIASRLRLSGCRDVLYLEKGWNVRIRVFGNKTIPVCVVGGVAFVISGFGKDDKKKIFMGDIGGFVCRFL